MAGRVSVVYKDLLSAHDFLETPDPETGQSKHRVREPRKAAVRPEAVISLVGQRGRVVPGALKPKKISAKKYEKKYISPKNLTGMSIECESGARSQSR